MLNLRMPTKLCKNEKSLQMLCMVCIEFSYFLFTKISILRLKFIFMPRKAEFGAFKTMSFVVAFFFKMGNSQPLSVQLFQLLHNLTDKYAVTLVLVNLMSPYLPRELPVPRFYIYHFYSCMRCGELYFLEGVKKH